MILLIIRYLKADPEYNIINHTKKLLLAKPLYKIHQVIFFFLRVTLNTNFITTFIIV